jgi:sirohydrochlorin ferrochelatase
MTAAQPSLLIAAHGTRSPAGQQTIRALVAAVAAARPALEVSLCFLDVAEPSLEQAVAATTRATVVVPLLLSSGYHVLTDIPAIAARSSHVMVGRHLGPDPLVIDALIDRLAAARSATAATTLLARVGSSRAEADAEFDTARTELARRLGRPVGVLRLDNATPERIRQLPAPVEIATYLLAEGDFLDRTRSTVDGLASVAAPIGAHPAIVALVLARYDAAV